MSSNDYVSRPLHPRPRPRLSSTDEREEWEKDKPGIHELQVTDDPEYVVTGILGADGEPIWKRNRWPLGFHQ